MAIKKTSAKAIQPDGYTQAVLYDADMVKDWLVRAGLMVKASIKLLSTIDDSITTEPIAAVLDEAWLRIDDVNEAIDLATTEGI